MRMWVGAAVLAMFVWTGGAALAQDKPDYIGIRGCTSKCHKKAEDGDQKTAWENSGHSEAFAVLGTDKAREAAQTVGVTGDPQKTEACLICHTTGFGADPKRFDRKFDMEDGVQCEACHGAGGDYYKKSVMVKISEELGPDKTGDSPTARETGLHLPTEETCTRCHSPQIEWNGKVFKNPSYEDFNYEERLKEIEHNKP